jgi:cell division protein FtsL
MKQLKVIINTAASAAILVGMLSIGGCKQQQQMQQQVEGLDGKVSESQKRITALDSELKKSSFELQQLKAHVIKLTNVVQDLQKAEDDRIKAAEASKSKKPAAKKAATKKR